MSLRQRFIHPEIWEDKKISKLSPVERLLFIGCFSNADDEGRLLGDPAYLRSAVFKYDDFTIEEIKKMRDRILEIDKNLVLYIVDGEEYLCFAKWKDYQKPKYPKPSKIPAYIPQKTEKAFSKKVESVKEELPHGLGLGRDGLGLGSGGDGSETTEKPAAVSEKSDEQKLDDKRMQITGRPLPTPNEIQVENEMINSLPFEQLEKVIDKCLKAYKPRYEGDKITTIAYFLPAVRQYIANLKVRDAPKNVIPINQPQLVDENLNRELWELAEQFLPKELLNSG